MTAGEQATRAYEAAETRAAQAGEQLVGTRGFGGLLGQMAENTAALTRIGSETMDLALRNLRVAGRRDVVRLSRQLARTEDKLERVLQELEELRSELALRPPRGSTSSRSRANASSRSTRGSAPQKKS